MIIDEFKSDSTLIKFDDRDIETKEEIKIPASKAPAFKAGKALKELVNK